MNAFQGHITLQIRHGNVRIIKNNWFLNIIKNNWFLNVINVGQFYATYKYRFDCNINLTRRHRITIDCDKNDLTKIVGFDEIC